MSVDTMYQLELKLWLRKILGIYSGTKPLIVAERSFALAEASGHFMVWG